MAIPGASAYLEDEALALLAWQRAQGILHGQRNRTLQEYGLTADFDNVGKASNYRIDPQSQYGALQRMYRGQADQYNEIRESNFSRGLRGPGLGNQGISDLQYDVGWERAQAGNAFQDAMSGINQNLTDEHNRYEQARLAALRQAALNAEHSVVAPTGPVIEPEPTISNDIRGPVNAPEMIHSKGLAGAGGPRVPTARQDWDLGYSPEEFERVKQLARAQAEAAAQSAATGYSANRARTQAAYGRRRV